MSNYNPDNPNSGHGHVFSRPDGIEAKCMGIRRCPVCIEELKKKMVKATTDSRYTDIFGKPITVGGMPAEKAWRFTAIINNDPIDKKMTQGAPNAEFAAQRAARLAEPEEIIIITDNKTDKNTYWVKFGSMDVRKATKKELKRANIMTSYSTLAAFKNKTAVRKHDKYITVEAGLGSAIKGIYQKTKLVGRNVFHNAMANHHYDKLQKHTEAGNKHLKAMFDAEKHGSGKKDTKAKLFHRYKADYHHVMAQHHAEQNKQHIAMAAKTDHEFANYDQEHNQKLHADNKRVNEAAKTAVRPGNPGKTKKEKHSAPVNAQGQPVKTDENGWPKGTEKWAKTEKSAPVKKVNKNPAVAPIVKNKPANKPIEKSGIKKPIDHVAMVEKHNKLAMKHGNTAKKITDKNSPEYKEHKTKALKHLNTAKQHLEHAQNKTIESLNKPSVKMAAKKVMPKKPLEPVVSNKPLVKSARKGVAKAGVIQNYG